MYLVLRTERKDFRKGVLPMGSARLGEYYWYNLIVGFFGGCLGRFKQVLYFSMVASMQRQQTTGPPDRRQG